MFQVFKKIKRVSKKKKERKKKKLFYLPILFIQIINELFIDNSFYIIFI